ncbi:Alanine--tRNA ligase [Linum perenne]
MNQYNKPIFLGTADPPNTQNKCIRANDLDDVGKDTFFEMLGNWSLDDDYYFKKEAIECAWDLLTKVYGLPTDRIYATYFGGDETAGQAPDNEARDIWLRFLPPWRVLPFGCNDNFWEMGDTGPCGPCTKIHYDRIGNRDAASLVNNVDDRTCIQIWNLVFIQFNRESDGSLKPLPSNHVHSRLGFERLTSALQNKMSNYDTDVFTPIFNAIQRATGARPYSGKVEPEDDVDGVDNAYRVVADHIRTLSFAIAHGSSPGDEGQDEYVLRHILRRAVCYGTEKLNAQQGFLNGLVKIVVQEMGDVFPELRRNEEHIREIITAEETSFGKILLRVLMNFQRKPIYLKAVEEVEEIIISGQDAFVLWDTYGFPLDFTQLMAEERALNFKVDVDGFNKALDQARKRSRSSRSTALNQQVGLHKTSDVYVTDDSYKYVWFEDHETSILGIYPGSILGIAPIGNEFGIHLQSTSFYAEQGGQIYDTGKLEGSFGSFTVWYVRILGGYILHVGRFTEESIKFKVGDKVICKVDYERRKSIAANHTCTHLLNFALAKVLGPHTYQKRSIVKHVKRLEPVYDERLREIQTAVNGQLKAGDLSIDFNHVKPVDDELLREIETIVNDQITAGLNVYAKEVSLVEALRVNGLQTLEGEVYPDPVSVVAIGHEVEHLVANPDNDKWLSISSQLCGGTHVTNTSEIKAFVIISERESANGIRRITALTGDDAISVLKFKRSIVQELNEASEQDRSVLEEKIEDLRRRVNMFRLPSVATIVDRVDEYKLPVAKEIDVRAKMKLLLKGQVRKIAEERMEKAVQVITEAAQTAASQGKKFCVARINLGTDTTAVLEATKKVLKLKLVSIMVFSIDDTKNYSMVCAALLNSDPSTLEGWLKSALVPLKPRGKNSTWLEFYTCCFAIGRGNDASKLDEAMEMASKFAELKLKWMPSC